MSARAMVYLHAASPLHAGTGQSLGAIDLPVQRERGTDVPVVHGSGVKGVLRAECEDAEENGTLPKGFVRSAFGSDDSSAAAAGAVTFGDARMLLFPVRSVRLLFAWVTCPYLLRRYLRDREGNNLDASHETTVLKGLGVLRSQAVCASADVLSGATERSGSAVGTVFIEDLDQPARVSPEVTALATQLASRCLPEALRPLLEQRLVVVDDTYFGAFVRQCTEVTARIQIEKDRKVAGNLWYEEALPAETILYSSVLAERTRGTGTFSGQQHIEALRQFGSAQLGGKASVGRGLCHLAWE